jgi:type I restriction enzyme S subunit
VFVGELVKLKEVAYYIKEKISVFKLSEENYISTDNILQNKMGITNAVSLPPKDSKVTNYVKDDILISNIRPYLKKIWFSDRKGGCSADVLALRINDKHYPKFIYYALHDDNFFDYVMQGVKGTKMPRGDKEQIIYFETPKLEYTDQQKIASVLSALDAKIELNNKINSELEAMAKTLYDYWFVQFDFPNEEGKLSLIHI